MSVASQTCRPSSADFDRYNR